MASIAIIGTRGAGKTVFLSVLAMRYRTPEDGRPWLEYRTRETPHYVAEAWDDLQRQEWPASTPVGTFPQLEWTLHASDGKKHRLLVRDPAGQDVRAIYDSPPDTLTPEQRDLKKIIDGADIVLFLVNLRDAIDAEGQMKKVDEIELPLKMAIQDVLSRDSRVALLLTQHDTFQFHSDLSDNGVPISAAAALKRYLPQVAGLLKTNATQITAIYVAAVAETAVVVENGKPYSRPKPGFTSEGLDTVLSWIEQEMPVVASIVGKKEEEERIAAEKAREEAAQQAAAEAAAAERQRRAAAADLMRPKMRFIGAVAAIVLVAAIVVAVVVKNNVFRSTYADLYSKSVKTVSRVVEEEHRSDDWTEYELTQRAVRATTLGDSKRDVTIKNTSKWPISDVTVRILIRPNIMADRTYTIRVDQLDAGASATAREGVECDLPEWRRAIVKVLCKYKTQRTEYATVHDDGQDGSNYARAQNEAEKTGWGIFIGGAVLAGFIMVWFFRVRSEVKNLVAAPVSP